MSRRHGQRCPQHPYIYPCRRHDQRCPQHPYTFAYTVSRVCGTTAYSKTTVPVTRDFFLLYSWRLCWCGEPHRCLALRTSQNHSVGLTHFRLEPILTAGVQTSTTQNVRSAVQRRMAKSGSNVEGGGHERVRLPSDQFSTELLTRYARFMRGNGINCIRIVPYSCVFFPP